MFYDVNNGNLPFLSSSAAKENVKAVVAIIRRIVNIFMLIERMVLLMNETTVERDSYLFEMIVEVIHTCFFSLC